MLKFYLFLLVIDNWLETTAVLLLIRANMLDAVLATLVIGQTGVILMWQHLGLVKQARHFC